MLHKMSTNRTATSSETIIMAICMEEMERPFSQQNTYRIVNEWKTIFNLQNAYLSVLCLWPRCYAFPFIGFICLWFSVIVSKFQLYRNSFPFTRKSSVQCRAFVFIVELRVVGYHSSTGITAYCMYCDQFSFISRIDWYIHLKGCLGLNHFTATLFFVVLLKKVTFKPTFIFFFKCFFLLHICFWNQWTFQHDWQNNDVFYFCHANVKWPSLTHKRWIKISQRKMTLTELF